ncbi:LamG-like jellyroll fold domain-containing protein [Desulfobacter curvatus]|uniref:LamG-like jellyroll fold domain-containing protein n=1 Tax=Desulfobacter curvatus TaxID=2290 RepID=UPI00146BA8AC|nr:LamG-like jellyroll fold domain-containing protein [Desulfobacter curvatus]
MDDVLTVSEGEMLDFSLLPPSGFGPDVQWTVTGLPDDRTFYPIPAFPGAEGFGARASGGRGGKVIKVTNLNREGPGSLAEALMTDGPRIIVFDVSGVIKGAKPFGGWIIPKSARLYTENAPVTIAAQTAPGAGITIEGQLSLTKGDGGEATDNAVVRFLRIRTPYHRNGVGDCISAYGSNTILDHVSGAWGNDENFDLSNLDHGSVQWCGIEESAGYGGPWEVYIDKDEDGMYDFWEAKVLDFSTTDDIDDYILDVVADGDLDGDGVTNIEEYHNGTNPLVAGSEYDPAWDPGYDSDRDGLLDWWEQQVIDADSTDNINDLTDIRPEDDLDGDLASNKEEHDNGTTPLQKPTHNYGMIVGYDAVNLSTHHNFFAHHSRRAPLSGVEVLDHRNNVIYNFSTAGIFHPVTENNQRPGELFKVNYAENYFKAGPNDPKLNDSTVWVAPWIELGRALIYDGGSYFDMYDDPSGYLDIFDRSIRIGLTTYSSAGEYRAQDEYPAARVTTQTAETAYGLVLSHAGALPKDAVTRRNVQDIKDRTGHWGKKMPTGGLMEGLSPGTAPLDSDNDGMPDNWETAHGLNPNDATDAGIIVKHGESVLTYAGSDIQGTENRYKGYTYIEYYINEIADQLILKELLANGYDHTYLPGYGIEVKPTVNWTPGYDEAGTYPITITATDGKQTITEQVTITVQDQNRAPYIYSAMYKENGTSMSNHQTNFVEVGQRLYFEFYAGDVDEFEDGDSYTVEFINAPDGYISRDTGIKREDMKGSTVFHVHTFEWIPDPNDVGWKNTVEIKLTDSHGRSYSKFFILEVSEADVPVHKIDAKVCDHGTISPDGTVYAQDGDSRTFTITPDDGYVVSDILIDGDSTDIKYVNTYILEGITSDHTIQPVFVYDPDSINGVILDMKFNGNMNDDSGLGNHGSTSGESQPTLTADRYGVSGKAYYFDGVDDYIEVMNNDYFSTPVFTIAAWVYSNKDWYNSSYIVSKNNGGGTNTICMYNAWDNLYACGTGYPRVENILHDRENEWLHIALVRNLTSTDFYLNGVYQGSYESVPGKDNANNLLIGAKSGLAYFFNGIIDEVKMWGRTLTAEQIAGITDYSIVTQSVPICTEFVYSDWGECQSGGNRSRTIVASLPEGCSGGNPVLTESCNYMAPCGDNVCDEGETCISCPDDCGVCSECTESDWSYSDGECQTNGTFVRTWTKTNMTCNGGITHPTTETIACTGDIPVAAFTADRSSGTAPLTVNFSDLSTNNPTSWFWTFDGGTPSTSTSQNPSAVYNDAGIYSVSLVVTNDVGQQDMETKEAFISVESSAGTGTDLCPDDPLKTEPGICGCGVPDEDTDADGVVNCPVKIKANCSTAPGPCYNSLSDLQFEYVEKDLVASNKEIDIECYNDWPDGLSDSFVLEGWTTDDSHHLNIYTPPAERHNGMVKDANGNYTGFAIELTDFIRIHADYTVVDGIIFNLMGNGSHVELGAWQKGGKKSIFKNNIVINARYRHLYLGDYQQIQVYNNFFINENSFYSAYGAIDCGPTNDRYYHEIYNNSIYIDGSFSGIVGGKYYNGLTITNNICYQSGTATECFTNIDEDYFSNNISSDTTGNLIDMTLDDILFTSTTDEQIDLHLQPDSIAVGSGLDLSSEFSEDIDGEIRIQDSWSIGGDDLLLD